MDYIKFVICKLDFKYDFVINLVFNLSEYIFLQDIAGCASLEELVDIFGLHKLCCARVWHIQGSSLVTNTNGTLQGLDWLLTQCV